MTSSVLANQSARGLGRVSIAPLARQRDHVLFSKYAGQTVKLNGEELLAMREDDVLGVIEGAAAALKKAA